MSSDAAVPAPPDDRAREAAARVAEITDVVPRIGFVLGSGFAEALGEALQTDATLTFRDLGFPPAGVPGHEGRLVLGWLAGVPVAVSFGRVHLYEGYGMDVAALLPRLLHALGVTTAVLTGAVGAVVADLAPGTLVVLTDHLNAMGTTPLRGWRYPDGTPAFIGMRDVYDPVCRDLVLRRAAAMGIVATQGVYAATGGPAYETQAELTLLRNAGAHVVGMSMVPEAVPARALGLRVVGLCMVTNALGDTVAHADVVRVAGETAVAVGRLLADVVPDL